jgi:uncharacterized tellurite resistance protein B-like protein
MFLQHLNDKEKKAFLTLAKEFILVDGALSQEEEALINVMKAEMGIEEGYPEGEKTREELFKVFETRKSRVAALIEMQGLGYANMEYHTEEQAFVQQMAEAFGVNQEELKRIDEWVVRQVALLYEANEFWAEESIPQL